jgi:hypothetical protein
MLFIRQCRRMVIMKTEIAQRISDEMNEILARLNGSIQLVMDNCEESEFQGYRGAVAHVMAAVVDVTNSLYQRNPEVKPVGYDETDVT